MSSDAADRGVKPPRTLFSLGRPGAKKGAGSDESAEAPENAPDDVAEEEEGELLFACGACGAILPGGAVFCGECGTPIDTSAFDDYPIEAEAVPAAPGADTVVITAPAANTNASDTVVVPPANAVPTPESDGEASSSEGAGLVTTQLPAPDHNATVNISAAAVAGAMAVAGVVSSEANPDLPDSPESPDIPENSDPDVSDLSALRTDADTQEIPVISVPEDSGLEVSAPDQPEPAEPDAPAEPDFPAEAATPAATLYADPATAEPLGRESSGQWVSDPSMGHVSTDDALDEPAALAGATATSAGPTAAAAAAATTTVPSAAAPVSSGLSGTTAAAMPYGTGPVESSEKSKVPMIAGIAAGGVVLLVIVAVLLSGGNKDSGTVASVDSSTTLRPVNTSSTAAPATPTTAKVATTSTTAAATTSTGDATTSSPAPDTTDTTTAPTLPPVTPPPTAAPPTTVRPTTTTTQGTPNLSFNSSTVTVAQGGSGTLNLTNSGSGPGGFLCSSANSVTVSPASGTVPAGNSIQITFTDQNRPGRFAEIICSLPNGNVKIVVGVS